MRVSLARVLSACSIALLGSVASAASAAHDMDPALEKQAEQAVASGVKFLRGSQAQDGSWSHSVGITALALRGYLESPGRHDAGDAAFVDRGIQFILSKVQPDGAISETDENRNYVPDCDLTQTAAQDNRPAGGDFCGAMVNANFGRVVPGATFDRDALRGWGRRNYNWEFAAGVQQIRETELAPKQTAETVRENVEFVKEQVK